MIAAKAGYRHPPYQSSSGLTRRRALVVLVAATTSVENRVMSSCPTAVTAAN